MWDVRFAHHGYYFATGGHDKTARLWATDQHQPLRIFAGHYSDVDVGLCLPFGFTCVQFCSKILVINFSITSFFCLQCVQFHPNSNYLASGSSDRTVRLWDCVSGCQVRLMTGHKVSWIIMYLFDFILCPISTSHCILLLSSRDMFYASVSPWRVAS